MQRKFMGTADCRNLPVRYYLLAEESEGGALYGVGTEWGGETLDLRDITSSRKRARALLGDLMRGQVTPVALRDVVDDWLLA